MKKIVSMVAMMLAALAPAGAQTLDGKTVFAKNCAACHQASGAGIPGAFPALKGNVFVQGEAAAVIATVLKGRAGMPTFASSLDDDKMALVLSYIRQSWGNKAGAISPADVTSVRASSGAGEAVKQEQPTNVH
jgi:cytochrome c6